MEKQLAMPDREISAAAEEGFRRLHELFGAVEPSPALTRRFRKYVLEYRNGTPIFRDGNNGRAFARNELELALAQVFDEVLDNDIVPQKLAISFPGSSFEPQHY